MCGWLQAPTTRGVFDGAMQAISYTYHDLGICFFPDVGLEISLLATRLQHARSQGLVHHALSTTCTTSHR